MSNNIYDENFNKLVNYFMGQSMDHYYNTRSSYWADDSLYQQKWMYISPTTFENTNYKKEKKLTLEDCL